MANRNSSLCSVLSLKLQFCLLRAQPSHSMGSIKSLAACRKYIWEKIPYFFDIKPREKGNIYGYEQYLYVVSFCLTVVPGLCSLMEGI